MQTKWWTCGCGQAQTHRGSGTPVCESCGKAAPFTVATPRGQGGFDFADESDRKTGYEE
jgi:hypothetical protein